MKSFTSYWHGSNTCDMMCARIKNAKKHCGHEGFCKRHADGLSGLNTTLKKQTSGDTIEPYKARQGHTEKVNSDGRQFHGRF